MMKKALILILVLFTACKTDAPEPVQPVKATKTITYQINPSVETYWIIKTLMYAKDDPLASQPLVFRAQEAFSSFARHDAVLATEELTQTYGDDELVEALLYASPVPESSLIYPLKADRLQFHVTLIEDYLKLLNDFYVDAGVASFLDEHRSYYEGAIKEIRAHIPDDVVGYMEGYYRTSFLSYTILPSPVMAVGGYRAIGPYVHTPEGTHTYFNMSGLVPVAPLADMSAYTRFGFDSAALLNDLTVHEFGHSFVDPLIDGNEVMGGLIEQSEQFFIPALQAVMDEQNSGGWATCVIEHLVRLGEIRVSLMYGDEDGAAELRQSYIEEGYVFLPELEAKIVEYEGDPAGYPTFQSFLPQLLNTFQELSESEIRARL